MSIFNNKEHVRNFVIIMLIIGFILVCIDTFLIMKKITQKKSKPVTQNNFKGAIVGKLSNDTIKYQWYKEQSDSILKDLNEHVVYIGYHAGYYNPLELDTCFNTYDNIAGYCFRDDSMVVDTNEIGRLVGKQRVSYEECKYNTISSYGQSAIYIGNDSLYNDSIEKYDHTTSYIGNYKLFKPKE